MIHSEDYTYRYRGGSLDINDPTYVQRPADDELYRQLRLGEFCYILTSRQMGKSSLMVRTTNRLRKDGAVCATIDLAAIGSQATPEQWYKGILYRLFRSLKISKRINWQTWWQEHNFLPIVQRLDEVIEGILLKAVTHDIVIFIDEIDSVISTSFSTDDFFAFIRACYGRRTENSDYNRLTFCLLGVATPSELIQDKRRTPFNIGQAIKLTGLTLEQAKPVLARGMSGKIGNPDGALAEILDWTGGQPFLTQKLCQLVVEKSEGQKANVKQIIQKHIINNWESQDEPEHLRTIRDRLLYDREKAITLLGRYENILKARNLSANGSDDDTELQLSGLVTIQNQTIAIANPIYHHIFNEQWVSAQLTHLWNIEDDTIELEQALGQEIPQGYTRKVVGVNLLMILISAASLYLHYGPFLGVSRQLEFAEYSRLTLGLIELARVVMLLVSSSYMTYFVWRSKVIEILCGKSLKVKGFRWLSVGLLALILSASVSHHFWSAPAYLKLKYHSAISVESEFAEYILPSIVYFPYSCVIHLFIALPFTLVSLYAVTDDLTGNWMRVVSFRQYIQDTLNKYSAVPRRLKHETIKNQFSKYALLFVNRASPYSTILLGVQVFQIFESKYGTATLTEPGERLAIITYCFSFFVVAIFVLLFAQYQRALRIASSALLYTGDKQVAAFSSDNQVARLLLRIVGSSINLILLAIAVTITLLSRVFSLF